MINYGQQPTFLLAVFCQYDIEEKSMVPKAHT